MSPPEACAHPVGHLAPQGAIGVVHAHQPADLDHGDHHGRSEVGSDRTVVHASQREPPSVFEDVIETVGKATDLAGVVVIVVERNQRS